MLKSTIHHHTAFTQGVRTARARIQDRWLWLGGVRLVKSPSCGMCACSSKSTWPPSTETKEDRILSLCTARRKLLVVEGRTYCKAVYRVATNILESCPQPSQTYSKTASRQTQSKVTNVFESCPQSRHMYIDVCPPNS